MLIGNLCKFDHCAVGLVVEGGGVQDLRRRFAMGRRQTGDRLARSERRKVMFPSLPAGGFTCADGQAVRGGARASAGLLHHRLGQGLREHGMAHRSGQSELLLEAVEERLDRVVVDAPARAARGAERRVTERRARG